MTENKGDLISRSYLKDRLAKHQSILDFEWNSNNLIASIIDNAPVVEYCNACDLRQQSYENGFSSGFEQGKNGRSQGRWIPVSERLPEENVCDDGYHEPSEWVLVQARNGHMYTTRYWSRDKKNVWTDLRYPDDIIAWQPLPEPYKEGGTV